VGETSRIHYSYVTAPKAGQRSNLLSFGQVAEKNLAHQTESSVASISRKASMKSNDRVSGGGSSLFGSTVFLF